MSGAEIRTPSGWHDDAANRDAGHDELQAAVWRWLSAKKGAGADDLEWVRVECPIISRERYGTRIIAFGDVVAKLTGCNSFLAYEVKPVIYSVGAVLRQLSAMEHAVSRVTDRNTGQPYPWVIRPVIPFFDPKLPLLREMSAWDVVAWDMVHGRPAR